MKAFLRVYRRSLSILWRDERLTTLSLTISGLIVASAQLAEPLLFGRVIDTLTRGADVISILGFWAMLGVGNVVASIFLSVMSDRLSHRQRLRMMGEVFERVISLPLTFHAEKGSGKVIRAILSGTDQLFSLWLAFMREHLPALVGVLILIPTALTSNWILAVLLFVLAAVYMVSNWAILNRIHATQTHIENYNQDVFGQVGDVIGNVSVVQSYTRLKDETRALQEIMTRLLRAQYPVLTWWGFLNVITRVSATVTMVMILGVGSYLAHRHEITVGQIVAFIGFSTLLIGKLDQLSAFFSRIVVQAPALINFFYLLDQKDGAVDQPHSRPLEKMRGEVEFDKVTHAFSANKQGVFGVTFKTEPGRTVALVGPSGSGKTTTLALLQRLFDPQSGQIRIDGQDIRGLTLSSLRENIATVFQEAGLFNRSIIDNIRVGRPSASDAEVEIAAKKADAHEFIMKKPGGYQFMIGERGSLLSGGERQRLAIARAVLKNSPILIFDEATSALDNETERRIQRAIQDLSRERTTFIIAHRLSTVVNVDLILVFDEGHIVEAGTFAELRAQGGAFARLLEAGELKEDLKESKA